jgi:hypothetical protein
MLCLLLTPASYPEYVSEMTVLYCYMLELFHLHKLLSLIKGYCFVQYMSRFFNTAVQRLRLNVLYNSII